MGAVAVTLGDVGTEINLLISQGDDFGPHLVTVREQGVPLNLTGATFAGGLKRTIKDTAPAALFSFNPVNLTAGEFSFSINRFSTERLAAGASERDSESAHVYDIKMLFQGRRVTLLYGIARVKPSVNI